MLLEIEHNLTSRWSDRERARLKSGTGSMILDTRDHVRSWTAGSSTVSAQMPCPGVSEQSRELHRL